MAALQSVMRGDFAGATSALLDAPTSIVNGILSGGGTVPGDDWAGINARSDAMQNWCWYCLVPTLKIPLPWYYVTAANCPMREINQDSIFKNGHQVNYPQNYHISGLQLSFYMDSSSKAMAYLKDWQSRVLKWTDPKNPGSQGLWGRPADYKKTIQVVMTSVDKKQLIVANYLNCWPTAVNQLDLISGAGDTLVATVPFACEDVDIQISSNLGVLDSIVEGAKGLGMSMLSGALTSAQSSLTASLRNALV